MPRKALRFLTLASLVATLLTGCRGAQNASQPVLPATPVQQRNAAAANTQVDWPTWGFSRQRTGFNAREVTLSTASVSGLTLKWRFDLGNAVSNTQPIVASNVTLANGTKAQIVFAADEGADFYALDADTGKLLWSKKLGTTSACSDKSTGASDTPVIDRVTNRVYIIDGNGKLWAFDIGTGALATGFPLTAFQTPSVNHTWSGLLLSSDGKTLYFSTASHCDAGKYYGTINAVNTFSRTMTTFHLVTDPAKYYANGVWSWGGESIGPANGNLYAGVGNSQGSLGEAGKYSDSVIELSSTLGFIADEQPEPVPNTTPEPDWDIGTTPIVYDDNGSCIAFQRKDGHFFTVNRTAIRNGYYGSKLNLGGTLDTPAYDPLLHALYVNVPHGLAKLSTRSNCTVTLAWQKTSIGALGYQVPIVANGVVYAAGKNVLYAFDANSGAALWNSGSAITGTIAAAPTVVNGRLYVTAWDGHLYAFGP